MFWKRKDCVCRHDDYMVYLYEVIGNGLHISGYIDFEVSEMGLMLYDSKDIDYGESVDISHCPFCGRKLNGKDCL